MTKAYSLHILLLIFSILTIISCKTDEGNPIARRSADAPNKIEFKQIDAEESGVDFSNNLDEDKLKMYFDYINAFNGGGVAIGDINNDNLPDLYFTGNFDDNKLFLNEGNFKFKDITDVSGVAGKDSWNTGVTMADINADGWLDIYVCRSYEDTIVDMRKNLLYINQGDNSFIEQAEKYGVADPGYSIQASFLDYDKDGDLDLFVANHPRYLVRPVDETYRNFANPKHKESDHLYQNNGNGTFTDVTEQAGVLNFGWSLGLSTADINGDGWPDIYVAGDHDLPDKYYVNQKNGTFNDRVKFGMPHISINSMGLDVADINNDLLNDVYVVDMLAKDNYRQKTQMAPMDPKKARFLVDRGYHIQTMRNMLHLNRGTKQFSEIGQIANVAQTDWSWAALFADLDLDGWKDLFVSNGYYKNILDKDKMKEWANSSKAGDQDVNRRYIKHIKNLPTANLPNSCFQNNQDLSFTDVSGSSGLAHQGISTGAAYGDLDNDGDLDIVINNIDAKAVIFSNQAVERGVYNYLKINLEAPIVLGAKVIVDNGAIIQSQELLSSRGYQSSVDSKLVFGLGTAIEALEIKVIWPNGKESILNNVKGNQEILININTAKAGAKTKKDTKPLFVELKDQRGINFRHREKEYDDYQKQVLLPHKLSQLGPFIAKADINMDGREDVFIGGAAYQEAAIYVQDSDGNFKLKRSTALAKDKNYEDIGACLADFNGDSYPDLYVASGGYEFDKGSTKYQDRLYINDGKGNFTRETARLEESFSSNSSIEPMDYDQDGDIDLFVGGRLIPGEYPLPTDSYLLENIDGKLINNDEIIDLKQIGMVTDAVWTDINQDGNMDLVVVGEWMSPKFYIQEDGAFRDKSQEYLDQELVGWWNTVEATDINGDGVVDLVLGNLGINYKYVATEEEPFHIYAGDLDDNGSVDIVLGYFNDSVLFPLRGKQCSSEQMPILNKEFKSYDAFAKASLEEVYGSRLDEAYHQIANKFESTVLLSNNGKYSIKDLPNMAQISPVNAILVEDFDQDGMQDLIIAGNLFMSEVETGRADAGQGLYLKGDGKGNFIPQEDSGLYLVNDVKDMIKITTPKGPRFIVASNDAYVNTFAKK